MEATYCISTYDPCDDAYPSGAGPVCPIGDEFGWHKRAGGLSRWQLRKWIRELRRRGYDDDLSILVERERGGGV